MDVVFHWNIGASLKVSIPVTKHCDLLCDALLPLLAQSIIAAYCCGWLNTINSVCVTLLCSDKVCIVLDTQGWLKVGRDPSVAYMLCKMHGYRRGHYANFTM